MPEQLIGTIRVQRPAGAKDALRRYQVHLDGHRAGAVASGDHLDLHVSAGPHRLAASISSAGSRTVEVDVAEGRTVEVEVVLAGHPLNPWREFTTEQYLRLQAPAGSTALVRQLQAPLERPHMARMSGGWRLALVLTVTVLVGVFAYAGGLLVT